MESYECGNYVMQWMVTIVRLDLKSDWEQVT